MASSVASSSLDTSPPVRRDLNSINKFDQKAFTKDIPVLAVRVDASKTNRFLKSQEMRSVLLDIPRTKPVRHTDSKTERLLLLGVSSEDQIPDSARTIIEQDGLGLEKQILHLDYDHWLAEDILHAVLPENLTEGVPSGFATTGHIAHFNLKEEYLPYKHLIGQIILDKNTNIRTVVNKVDSIANEYRVFQMETIAGPEEYDVEVNESDCRFRFDFSKVYWNSRLQGEHERLVALFQPGQIVVDIFAGVGPFAIPAAKKGCGVYANDLNPSSVKYLEENVKLNNIQKNIVTHRGDGGAFIAQAVRAAWDDPFQDLSKPMSRREEREVLKKITQGRAPLPTSPSRTASRRVAHFVMNLPESALSFLTHFRGVFNGIHLESEFEAVYSQFPMVHCYCFTRELEKEKAEADIRQRAQVALGAEVENDASFHLVRSVAPNKEMYCLSFRLPRRVGIAS